MIFYETHLDEKLQGNLATALKDIDSTYKSKFIEGMKELDIDFSRAIDKAVYVKSARDSRLKSPQYVVIGVYSKPDGSKGMVAYRPKTGAVVDRKNETLIDKNGDKVTVKNFGSLSWTKWLGFMTDVYVIDTETCAKYSTTMSNKAKARDQRMSTSASTNKSTGAVSVLKDEPPSRVKSKTKATKPEGELDDAEKDKLAKKIDKRAQKSFYKIYKRTDTRLVLVPTEKGWGLPDILVDYREKSPTRPYVRSGSIADGLVGREFDRNDLTTLIIFLEKASNLIKSLSSDSELYKLFK